MVRNFYNVPAAVITAEFEKEIKEAAVALYKITLYSAKKIAAIVADLFKEKFIIDFDNKNFDMGRLSPEESIDAWKYAEGEYNAKGCAYVFAVAYLAIIDYQDLEEGNNGNA